MQTTDPNAYINLYVLGLLIALVGGLLGLVSPALAGGPRRNGPRLLAVGAYTLLVGQALLWITLLWLRDPRYISDNAFVYPPMLGAWAMLVGSVVLMVGVVAVGGARWWLAALLAIVALAVAVGVGSLVYTYNLIPLSPSFLTPALYGGLLLLATLALLLFGRSRSSRLALGRALMGALVGAALILVLLLVRGPTDWNHAPYGLDVILASLAFGIALYVAGRRFLALAPA